MSATIKFIFKKPSLQHRFFFGDIVDPVSTIGNIKNQIDEVISIEEIKARRDELIKIRPDFVSYFWPVDGVCLLDSVNDKDLYLYDKLIVNPFSLTWTITNVYDTLDNLKKAYDALWVPHASKPELYNLFREYENTLEQRVYENDVDITDQCDWLV